MVFGFCASMAFAAKVRIDVPVVTQEQTEWCWVGVSASVLRYYSQTVTQCQIANYARTTATWHDFGNEDCCTNGAGGCNYWNYNYGREGSIQEILKKWGVGNNGMNRPLTLPEIATQLDAKRPFIVRWAYVAGGGHFIVGHGVSDSSIHYMDPWPGEGSKIAKYSWIVANPAKTWAETNVLTTSPTASVSNALGRSDLEFSARSTENGVSVSYRLDRISPVRIQLATLRGEVLATLDLHDEAMGSHSRNLSTTRLSPGGYVLRIECGADMATTVLFEGN
jgi:hypothetical protein